jgi:hypothetical protein
MSFPALVITTIHAPSDSMRSFSEACNEFGVRMIVVGDKATPAGFNLPGCEYYDLNSQSGLGFRFGMACPEGCYARKNIGYLIALRAGAPMILESDDDNSPLPGFFSSRSRRVRAAHVVQFGWVNVYSYFTDKTAWPRGFPLDALHTPPPAYGRLPIEEVDCPIQQGLVDGDADVDAIFRLVCGAPPVFRAGNPIALGRDSWCPVNSQNTAWWAEAAALMYLPVHCSFRMTDLWRGLVAQRIAWENGWSVLFHGPTVRQDRNYHNLMEDFQQEIPAYLHMRHASEVLSSLSLTAGVSSIPGNMRACYGRLIEPGIFPAAELGLLDEWLADIELIASREC